MPAAFGRPETAAAVVALRAALPIVMGRLGADDVRLKGPADIVTGTDLASQAVIERVLRERHPDCAFVGEEGASLVPASGRYWLVDPVCGTANFAAQVPLYAINIALVEDGRVTVAAIADGATGDIYVAERGRGAWQLRTGDGEKRLQASAASGMVSLDANLPGPDALSDFGHAYAVRVLQAARWDVRMFATTLALAYVASGKMAAAVYAASGLRVHFAAGLLLAQEAGAIVTDERGKAWELEDAIYVVAATPALHRELQELAQAVATELQSAAAR